MSEDPHERIIDELEKELEELKSADEISEKQNELPPVPEQSTPKEADKYKDKNEDEWKRNDHSKDTRLVYTEEEIEVVEEDL